MRFQMGNLRGMYTINTSNDWKSKSSNGEQFRKLFIGGLTPFTDEVVLRQYYQQYGDITDVVVMKDSANGRSRGFGFVTFRRSAMLDAAQRNRPHIIDGKKVESKRAMPREDAMHPETHLTVKKLFVGGLLKGVRVDDLTMYFSGFGRIVHCEIVCYRNSGEPRGFGFIYFDDYDSVDKVILCRPHFIHSMLIDVRKAFNKYVLPKLYRKRFRPHSCYDQCNQDLPNDQKEYTTEPVHESNNNNTTPDTLYPYLNKYRNVDVLDPTYYTGGYNSRGIFPMSKGLAAFYKPHEGFISNTLKYTSDDGSNIDPFHIFMFTVSKACMLSNFIVSNHSWEPSPLTDFKDFFNRKRNQSFPSFSFDHSFFYDTLSSHISLNTEN